MIINYLKETSGKILGEDPDLKLIDYGFFGQWMITQEVWCKFIPF